MRVLFLSSIYPRSYDHVFGIYSYSLCKHLALKHDVRVVSPQSWVERLTKPSPYDEQLSAPVGPTVYPCYYYPPKLFRDRYADFMWTSIRGIIRRVVADFRPDCVVSYWAHPDGEVAVRAARLAGVPVAITVGGSDVLLLTHASKRRRVIVDALRAADAVLAVSQDLRDKIVDLAVDPAKVHLFHQGLEGHFSPGDRSASRKKLGLALDRKMLFWVGRMVPVKGIDILLQACATLRSERNDFDLVLAGDGPLRKGLEADVARLGLSGVVRFVGLVPNEQLPDWYRAADLTVLSSHSEGIPNVLRESLACGTPYVTTNVGGISELSDDPANWLVPPGNSNRLAEALSAALRQRRALAEANTFRGWGECADTVLRLLRPDLVGRGMNIVSSVVRAF